MLFADLGIDWQKMFRRLAVFILVVTGAMPAFSTGLDLEKIALIHECAMAYDHSIQGHLGTLAPDDKAVVRLAIDQELLSSTLDERRASLEWFSWEYLGHTTTAKGGDVETIERHMAPIDRRYQALYSNDHAHFDGEVQDILKRCDGYMKARDSSPSVTIGRASP